MTLKLSKNLKFLLLKNDIACASLAKQLDIPVQTLHNWLSGALPRNITKVKKLSDHFDLTIDQILFGEVVTLNKEKKTSYRSENLIDQTARSIGNYEIFLRYIGDLK